MKAIVIGGGIGGITTGLALRHAGIDVTVFERQGELKEVGSGLTLWVNAMRALRKIGAADAVKPKGSVPEFIDNRSWRGGELKALPIHKVAEKFGMPSVGIHRAVLQNTLASLLPKGVLQLSTQCTAFSQDAEGVTVKFADGREERGDVLIGADGINSTIRNQLFGLGPPRYSGYTCWRSAVKLEHPLLKPSVYTQLYGRGCTFGIFAIGEGSWSWYGTKMTPQGGGVATTGPERKKEAVDAFAGWYEPVRAVIEATPDSGFFRQDICDRVPIESWGTGRVTLLGDAAHATTPTLGQGGCMAIEDAVILARNLKEGADIPSSLKAYEARRKPRANGIVRQARRHGIFYHAASPALGLVRDTFFKTAPVMIAMHEVEKLMGYEA
jgi:2-polyprenyl-6-methoxyphenol hydroxylase-like FAD-dependent oxidoreductase